MAAAAATAAILSAILAPFLGAKAAASGAFNFKGLFGMLSGFNIMGKADGGYISGRGTSRSDSIPAMLSNGEFVVNAAAVRKIGRNNLEAINTGKSIGGGMAVSVDVSGQLRGDTIYFANQRAGQTINRNG
jgi:hypothetical protein